MISPMDLSGSRVLVTGASSGIGRQTSVLLGLLGASLILVGRDHARLQETWRMMGSADHRVEPFDLEAVNDIPAWLKRLAAEVGPLAGLVHCAGLHFAKPLATLRGKDVERIMGVNVSTSFALARGFRQKGCFRAGGSMVFLASVVGLVGQPGVSAYSASKGAVIALTRSLALELARDGIRVNCVAPGYVQTEMSDKLKDTLSPQQYAAIELMHPLGIGSPLDVAHAVAFLLAPTGRWITGTTLVVDGGYTAH
jgi:NAD(P)-dependent dehydrogenase (short-subunit alcohol dehydrogenase family)